MRKSKGHTLKAQGQASVLANSGDWVDLACDAIAAMKWPQFTLEEVKGIPAPRHPNAWGALATLAQHRGLIVKSGQYKPSWRAAARGRLVAVYRKGAK